MKKGLALDNMQKFKEATELYDKALEIEPDSAIIWYLYKGKKSEVD